MSDPSTEITPDSSEVGMLLFSPHARGMSRRRKRR
jgi:hypothetical protein